MTIRPRSLCPRAPLAVLCALLLVCGGCRLRADVVLDLQADLSGTLTVALRPDAELRRRLADAGLDLTTLLTGAVAGEDGWDVRTDGTGVTVASDFDSPEELMRRSEELADGLAAAELHPLEPFTVAVEGREVVVGGGASLVPTDNVAELGYTPSEATAALADAVDYRVVVTAPGEVNDTSPGAVVEEGTAVWEVPAGERVDVMLAARRPLLTPLRIVVGGLAAAVLAVGVWLATRRVRRSGDAV